VNTSESDDEESSQIAIIKAKMEKLDKEREEMKQLLLNLSTKKDIKDQRKDAD